MTVASPTLTWDIAVVDGGARRPSLADVGGATCLDEDPEPDKATMLYADLVNQLQFQVAALGKVAASTVISVHIAAGTPGIIAAVGPGIAVIPSLFTVTDNGTGDTSITWPAGSLPPPTGIQPLATVNSGTGVAYNAHNITNGVRMLTWTSSTGAAVDADFTIEAR